MHMIHIKRWHFWAASLLIAAGALVGLAGCHKAPAVSDGIPAATEEARLAYLSELGWQVEEVPIETLDLQLPEDLLTSWSDYVALQEQQSFPFGGYAGQTVRRYTYTVTNYPDIPKGVQINLFLCDDLIIGGDLIVTGENGFQTVLTYPETKE